MSLLKKLNATRVLALTATAVFVTQWYDMMKVGSTS
jgi:hypothetical protein